MWCPGKVFSGGGTGRPAKDGKLESAKAGSESGREKLEDTGCSVLGDGFLSGLARSVNGRGGGAEVKGDGRLWAEGRGAVDGDGAYPSVFFSANTSEMDGNEGSDCRWAWLASESSEGLRGSTGEIMPGMLVAGAEWGYPELYELL